MYEKNLLLKPEELFTMTKSLQAIKMLSMEDNLNKKSGGCGLQEKKKRTKTAKTLASL